MSEQAEGPIRGDTHATSSALGTVLAYHDQSKHHMHRYAQSLGYLDWATQPDPFRRYEGAPRYMLDEIQPTDEPTHDVVLAGLNVPVRACDRLAISQLFYDSLALSAWKDVPATGARWSVRANPSSGNLHPTEGYLLTGAIEGINDRAALYHYAPFEHCLEQRTVFSSDRWLALIDSLPEDVLLIGLTSIYWRESWKYGERAFRYCQHDMGHAVGGIVIAAAALGWHATLLPAVTDQELAVLLATDMQPGIEAEHPGCLLAVWPRDATSTLNGPAFDWNYRPPPSVLEQLRKTEFAGKPNILSHEHHDWPVIDTVSDATLHHETPVPPVWDSPSASGSASVTRPANMTKISIRKMIRQRRSAVAMDGETGIDQATFYRMLQHVMPQRSPVPFASLPWPPCVHLIVFVHRVQDMKPGLYALVREMKQMKSLRGALDRRFVWQKPFACPDDIELFLLQPGNFEEAAKTISCHQDIAADGAFALGMIAHFEPTLRSEGPWFYKRLFWETGMIGQVLYLESEAVSESVERFRATGIGCFFDDAVHNLLGVQDREYQSLYHFTVGGALDDARLHTGPPYEHRSSSAAEEP